jgi:hypothetical protein
MQSRNAPGRHGLSPTFQTCAVHQYTSSNRDDGGVGRSKSSGDAGSTFPCGSVEWFDIASHTYNMITHN